MSTPTIYEMRRKVASMLPGVLDVNGTDIYWLRGDEYHEVMETEWREVCALAEETLTDDDWKHYIEQLWLLQPFKSGNQSFSYRHLWGKYFVSLPFNARLEALCRVRHPEMFTK